MHRKNGFVVCVVVLVAVVGLPEVAAQLPSETVPVTGILADPGGLPVVGPATLVFRIYQVPVGGAPIWTETHAGVLLDGAGRYHRLLGSLTPLTPSIFVDMERWLSIEANSDGEMSPRLLLSSMPSARNSSLLDGSPPSVFAPRVELSDGTPATTPVGWNDLLGVPPGFGDGVDDDTQYSAGIGLSLVSTTFSVRLAGTGVAGTAARSDHDHDARYARLTQLVDMNPATAPVHWNDLIGVPAGFADGVDDDTQYSAGSGLRLIGSAFSADYAGTGAAFTLARSDHLHPAAPGGSSGTSLTFPDGLAGMSPVTVGNLASVPYSVPAGSTLYITSYHSTSTGFSLVINGIQVYFGLAAHGASSSGRDLALPLAAGAGDLISSNNNATTINGFLVSAGVTTLTASNLTSTPYQVPAGQVLVILGHHSTSTGWNLSIDGNQVWFGLCAHGASSSATNMEVPLLAGAGQVVSSNNNAASITGYLWIP